MDIEADMSDAPRLERGGLARLMEDAESLRSVLKWSNHVRISD